MVTAPSSSSLASTTTVVFTVHQKQRTANRNNSYINKYGYPLLTPLSLPPSPVPAAPPPSPALSVASSTLSWGDDENDHHDDDDKEYEHAPSFNN
jgi:hypothetical protein